MKKNKVFVDFKAIENHIKSMVECGKNKSQIVSIIFDEFGVNMPTKWIYKIIENHRSYCGIPKGYHKD